ncbi:Hypothetical predicted protein [Mytilus galloprovincialis]|uniref:Integrase catalytic domain-containing protein n=1 Tax=Mytilus galloprovincialis TaxID=29158 RepID=A0A8B6BQM9_MYTGA|nr:Hypothetical predicted protein [Mytilus galloprovincialis]
MIKENHKKNHRKADTIYEALRTTVFPVVRETIKILFKTEVRCQQCASAIDLPKTTTTRRPITATYPNSRWQVDLKKMPAVRGYTYACNIIDCYSRFAFGGPTKTKTAKEIADLNSKIPFTILTQEERLFLTTAHLDVEDKDLEPHGTEESTETYQPEVGDGFISEHINDGVYPSEENISFEEAMDILEMDTNEEETSRGQINSTNNNNITENVNKEAEISKQSNPVEENPDERICDDVRVYKFTVENL